jgi:hypothetical protein
MTPIRKGANPVKIPFQIRTTDRTLAAWCNEVRTALQQLEARQPTANFGRGASAGGGRPPFFGSVSRVPESDPPEYQATFTLGYLTYQNAGASEAEQGVTGYVVPKIKNEEGQWISMDAESPQIVPPIVLPSVTSWVYLRIKTTADGVPEFNQEDGPTFTIEAFSEEQKSIHHVRPSPGGGEEKGDYYFLLLQTEGDGGDPEKPAIVRRITGNREMPNQLIEITNIGGKRELYQGYLPGPDDKHELRTIEQLITEGGAEIIKPLEDGEEEGETIKWRNVKKDNDSSVPFSITGEGSSVKVRMEGTNDPYIDPFGGQIGFAGGLATSVQGGAFNGWWGTIEWVYEAAGGSEETYLHLRQTFRNGILTKVEYWSGVAPVDAPGTEGSPAIVVYNMTDS